MSRREYERIRAQADEMLAKECANCEATDDLHIHHIVPLALGGTNRLANLVRLCTGCHEKAHGGKFALITKAADTLRSNAVSGKRRSGKVPYGYLIRDGEYIIDEDKAEIVRYIYRLRFIYELSTTNIAEILNYMAVPTAGSAKSWTHPVVKRIIDNPQYVGHSTHQGEIVAENVYPAIIDASIIKRMERFADKYESTRVKPRKFEFYIK